jgi:hypothetical protein
MLIQLLVIVIVLGLVYWLVMQLPLPAPFKMIAQVIMILVAIFWLLGVAGMLPSRMRLSAFSPHDPVLCSVLSHASDAKRSGTCLPSRTQWVRLPSLAPTTRAAGVSGCAV